MHNLHDKLIKVHDRVHRAAEIAYRDASSIQLIAVSKTQPAEKLREAFAADQHVFGENYLQEALDKQTQLSDLAIEWHFIGPIQSNKTAAIANQFSWVHSLDREKIARRLNEQRAEHLPALNVCLQVNIDDEDSKSGVRLDEVDTLAKVILALPRLKLRGLMAIPAPRDTYQAQFDALTPVAAALRDLQQRLNYPDLNCLSMGMSADLEAAIAAGATMVRVGTDIFGAR